MKIIVHNLKKNFGEKTAVHIPEFSINSGDILGLVGNNGAGKTTLFRLMLDLLKADEGNVIFKKNDEAEIDPATSEEWKSSTGAYIDEGFLIDFLTPEEYFEFIGKVNNLSLDDVHVWLQGYERFMADEILGQKKLIRDFSAGNKQKIGILSAMLNQPELLILDEPFNFLDPSSQNILKNMLVEYNQSTGATILISSHNLQHTVDISTRIALLEHGEIIKDLSNHAGSAEQELNYYFNV
ncbi:MAG: ABC transporter ATP-binding protein [Prevotella sp.]|jgi:ABC-2 type transport system ATP-binding protein|nr:ABC transporter ATP-binding protein [Prevotella sp.]MCI2079874.1 ABC transporter ATP-binding protein [Prevotella sp.]MCI2102138.1 ABC transporter ATP-binding protein [Prevotella sp.]